MAMAVEDFLFTTHDLDLISGSTTTTSTTTTDDGACTWNDWSPVVDWDAFSNDPDDFRGLIESMLIDNNNDDEKMMDQSNRVDNDGWCNSDSTITPITITVEEDEEEEEEGCGGGGGEDLKGLRLVHLLMAAAEALTGSNSGRDLARVILVRLKELVSPNDGSNMERLAAYFTQALHNLLEGAGGVHNNKYHNNHTTNHYCGPHREDYYPVHHHHHGLNQSDVLAAFQLLQDMSPYVKFGHFTANQAILEAVAHDRRVHIVDYDIMEGVQWASLIQALASRKDGPPAPHLRITALSRSGGGGGGGARKSLTTVQETGRRLAAFAASLGQPFSFHQCRVDSDESFRPASLKLVRGEALVINCMLHFPHNYSCYRGPGSVASFLSGAQELNPRLVTLVEEEVGRTGESGFVGRFMDSLHHYSAVCDSLEAGFPMQSRARGLVEKVFLGPRIAGTVARVYRAPGEEEGGWAEWASRVGLEPVGLSFANQCQARLLVGLFNDGYRVEESGSNKIILGWKSRRIISASVWAPVGPADSL